ncbi:fimbria/pilus outer membrane usher protein [Escherichia coli]
MATAVAGSVSRGTSLELFQYCQTGTGNNHASDNASEQIYMLSLSVPLSGWWGNSYATYSVSQNDNSGSSHQLGLSGTALERNNLSWNLMQSYNSHDDEVGGNMSLPMMALMAR